MAIVMGTEGNDDGISNPVLRSPGDSSILYGYAGDDVLISSSRPFDETPDVLYGGTGKGVVTLSGASGKTVTVVHGLPRSRRILRAQRFEDFTVLLQRLLEAAVEAQRIAAGELDQLARVVDQLREVAVAGDFLQGGVEALVGFEEAVGIVGRRMVFELLVNRREPGKVGAGGTARRQFGDPAFEHGHDGKDFVDVLFR